MTCVVTEACIACRYGDCVDACPVDAFRVGENFVVIDPEVCVNCTVCVPACPVSAIVADYELNVSERQRYVDLNATLSKEFGRAQVQVEALADAQKWADVKDKLHLLIRP
ncbi:MAG: ferredoxin [Alcaligenaceae bacterium]|jgi:ferredoxin|nr:ferredoxin [Alcaligenaceae bacterium]